MDCSGCEGKIAEALDQLPFLSATEVSFDHGQACGDIQGEPVEADVVTTLKRMGYTVTSVETTDNCSAKAVATPQNWADIGDSDVQIISNGERVELTEHAAEGKFTVYDFGAPWCGPCHVSEKLLKQYIGDHEDVAVRAIVLNSPNPKESFDLPAAKQHLLSAPGLPYFIVVNAKGKNIFRGVDLPKALKQIDKRR